MPHERPPNAKNDYWLLTDDDLRLAIEDVRQCMRHPLQASQSLWSLGGSDTSHGRLQTLLSLRTEQVRRLTTPEVPNGE